MTYRTKIQIVTDIIVKLTESEPISRTTLLSYCNLNVVKHGEILDQLVRKELIHKEIYTSGKKSITRYSITPKGTSTYQRILVPYEELFPRN